MKEKVTLNYLLNKINHHLNADTTFWGILRIGDNPLEALTLRFEMIKRKVRAVDARVEEIRKLAKEQGNSQILALLNDPFDFLE